MLAQHRALGLRHPYMLANGTGKALVKSGGDTRFFLTADCAFGQALERDTAPTSSTANGGKVLGGVRHPLINVPTSPRFLLQARSSKAKIIELANAGGTTNSIKQTARVRHRQGRPEARGHAGVL